MSQIKTKIYFLGITANILLALLLAIAAGCGNPNSQSIFDPDTGEHPGSWVFSGHSTTYQADQTACDGCHSISSGGTSGIACTSCHINGSPAVAANCTSCHSKPPSGAAYPNIEGAHTEHDALTNVTNVCNTCHNGAGSGTVYHYSGAVDVQYLSAYNAESGTASYNSGAYTCSKISCHGGITTPNWRTQTIDVTDTASCATWCHASGTAYAIPEYNSYSSGKHYPHVTTFGYDCTECHDATTATKLPLNHFTTLNTSAMEGPASGTLIDDLAYDGTCAAYCHGSRAW